MTEKGARKKTDNVRWGAHLEAFGFVASGRARTIRRSIAYPGLAIASCPRDAARKTIVRDRYEVCRRRRPK